MKSEELLYAFPNMRFAWPINNLFFCSRDFSFKSFAQTKAEFAFVLAS
jgi:hypothetical protein